MILSFLGLLSGFLLFTAFGGAPLLVINLVLSLAVIISASTFSSGFFIDPVQAASQIGFGSYTDFFLGFFTATSLAFPILVVRLMMAWLSLGFNSSKASFSSLFGIYSGYLFFSSGAVFSFIEGVVTMAGKPAALSLFVTLFSKSFSLAFFLTVPIIIVSLVYDYGVGVVNKYYPLPVLSAARPLVFVLALAVMLPVISQTLANTVFRYSI